MDKSILSTRIKDSRERCSLTQDQLARQMGVSVISIQNWERGESVPNSVSLGKIADRCNVTTDWLLGRSSSVAYSECLEFIEQESDLCRLAAMTNRISSRLMEVTVSYQAA